jgi:ferredoxin
VLDCLRPRLEHVDDARSLLAKERRPARVVVGNDRIGHLSPLSQQSGYSDGPRIEFARSDLTVAWNNDYNSLLELVEACDVPVRWSCRTGVCHNCEITLIAGDLDYNPEPVEPPATGSALICCSQPRDDVVLDL